MTQRPRLAHRRLARIAAPLAVCALSVLSIGCDDSDVSFAAHAGYDTELPQLVQQYATVLTSTVVQTHRETGERSTHVTRIAALAAPTQQAARFDMQLSLCNIELPRVEDTDVAFDESFLQDRDKVPAIDVEGGLFVDDDGIHLVTTVSGLLLGVSALDDSGRIPADGDHPNVIDQDDDDEPGVSVAVGPGRVFVGLATRFELDGTWDDSDGSARGDAYLELDKQIYGDTIWLVDVRERADEQESAHTFESSATFSMTPVAPELGCETFDAG